MRKGKVLFVLPKMVVYQYKDDDIRSYIRNSVYEWFNFYKDADYQIYMFAEDMLAVELFGHEDGIKWLTVLGQGDRTFISQSVDDIPKAYFTLEKTPIDARTISDVIRKYPPAKPNPNIDEIERLGARFNLMLKRIRKSMDLTIPKYSKIVWMDARNNNSVSKIESELGDGKSIVTIKLNDFVTYCTVGGSIIKDSIFKEVIKLNGNV